MIKPDIEYAVIICYKNGLKFREIIAKLGVSSASISRILKRNHIPVIRKSLTKDTELNVIELYNKGLSILEIIATTGVKSEQTIYRILSDAGTPRRRKRCTK